MDSLPEPHGQWSGLDDSPVPSLDHSQLSDSSEDLYEDIDLSSAGIFQEYASSQDDGIQHTDKKPPPLPDLMLIPGWDAMTPPSPEMVPRTTRHLSETSLYSQFPAWAGRKQRRKPKSLLRTPNLVQVTDGRHGQGMFPPQISVNGLPQQPNVTIWRRGDGDLVEPPIWAGFPSLPSFPSRVNRIITDGEKCDIYGRKECSDAAAIALLLGLTVFPPAWLMLASGYFDAAVGVVPSWAKLTALALGLAAFCAAVVLSIVLSLT